MQRKFQKKKKPPPLQARSLHTLIAAYLLLVGNCYDCKPLVDYVLRVVNERQEQGQMCRYLEMNTDKLVILTVVNRKYSDSTKHRLVTVFFERNEVINALSTIPALQQEYGEETLKTILSRKYQTLDRQKKNEGIRSNMPSPRRSLPPFVPLLDVDGSLDGKKSHSVHYVDDWSMAPNGVCSISRVNNNKVKVVHVDALRKVLDGRETTGQQTDGVTLLLTKEQFPSVATRCLDANTERAKLQSRIISLATEKDTNNQFILKMNHKNGGSSSSGGNKNMYKIMQNNNDNYNNNIDNYGVVINNNDMYNANGNDNSTDTVESISELSTLKLDLFTPLKDLGPF